MYEVRQSNEIALRRHLLDRTLAGVLRVYDVDVCDAPMRRDTKAKTHTPISMNDFDVSVFRCAFDFAVIFVELPRKFVGGEREARGWRAGREWRRAGG